MKISELKIIVDDLHEKMIHGEINDLELVIPNGKESYGTIGYTRVRDIICGFDWNSNLLIIVPNFKMIEK